LELQLRDIKLRGFNIIYVTNLKVNAELRMFLSKYVDVLIERPNYGRDIAGYKEGFNFILNNNMNAVEDLLFTNDTIIYPVINADQFWRDLYSHSSVITGAYVSYQISRHIQSYFLLCKNRICYSEKFKQYWRQYKCSNSRQKVIVEGEIGFSQWMINSGIEIGGVVDEYKISIAEADKLTESFLPYSYLKLYNHDIENLRYNYEDINPSHVYALWSIFSLGIPLVKKDLLSRGTFNLVEFIQKFSKLKTNIRVNAVVDALLIKDLPSQKVSFYKKFLNKIGAN
jgi:rhamnosyltransferase